MGLAALAFAAVLLLNLSQAGDPSAAPRTGLRLREGTRLQEVAGRFEPTGERITFVMAESGESVRVLENLALERVSRMLSGDGQEKKQWTVCGIMSEYNNGNYLLITKAVQAGGASGQDAKPSGIGTRPKDDYPAVQAKKPPVSKKPESSHDHP